MNTQKEVKKTKNSNNSQKLQTNSGAVLRVDPEKKKLSDQRNQEQYYKVLTQYKKAQTAEIKARALVKPNVHPYPQLQQHMLKKKSKSPRVTPVNDGWPSLEELDKQGKRTRAKRTRRRIPQKKKAKHVRKAVKKEVDEDQKSDWLNTMIEVGGRLATHFLPLLLGAGDYEEAPGIIARSKAPEENSFLAHASDGKVGGQVPMMHSDGMEIRVANREYLGDIVSTTQAFAYQKFVINVGMQETFPWLEPIGAQLTNYKIEGAVAEIISEGSDYASSAGLGWYGLASQYNVLETPFLDKREFLNSAYADAAKPSTDLIHCIECKEGLLVQKNLSVRTGEVPPNADLRMYDHSNLFLAVGGNVASGITIGELWISYDVKLMLPRTKSSSGSTINFFECTSSTGTNATPLGTAWTRSDRNTFQATVSADTIVFPPHLRGDFMVHISWTSGTPVSTTSALPNYTLNNILQLIGTRQAGQGVTNGTGFYKSIGIRILSENASLQVATNGNIAQTNASVLIQVNQIPRPLTTLDSPIFDRGGIRNVVHDSDIFDEEGNLKPETDDHVGTLLKQIDDQTTFEVTSKDEHYLVQYFGEKPVAACKLSCREVRAVYAKSSDLDLSNWIYKNFAFSNQTLVDVFEADETDTSEGEVEEKSQVKENKKLSRKYVF